MFKWDCSTESIFQKVKGVITASPVLTYFDPEKETRIQVDASKNGLGATLMQDGKPVAFAYKSLRHERPMHRLRKNCLQSYLAVKNFMNTSMAER